MKLYIYETSSKTISTRDELHWAAITNSICRELHSGSPLQRQGCEKKLRPGRWKEHSTQGYSIHMLIPAC